MQLGEIKKRLQGHFTDGLVTIVGSGLSMASGLPGMEELAEHLIEVMGKRCKGEAQTQWEPIETELRKGIAIEEALKNIEVDNPVLERRNLNWCASWKKQGEFIWAKLQRMIVPIGPKDQTRTKHAAKRSHTTY